MPVLELGPFSRRGRLTVVNCPQAIFDGKGELQDAGDTSTVFCGDVQRAWAGEVDEGFYRWSHKESRRQRRGNHYGARITYGHQFVGVTAEEFSRLAGLRPKAVKSRLTSDGMRYFCTMPRCDNVAISEIGALRHEAEHFGQTLSDLLRDDDVLDQVQEQAQKSVRSTAGRKQDKATKDAFMRTARQSAGLITDQE